MQTFLRLTGWLALPLFSVACGAGTDGDIKYDEAKLAAYRAAIPTEEQVAVVVPGPEAKPNALTQIGDAELAALAIDSASKVNAPARAMVRTLRKISTIPPTAYDANEKKFVWGPWENDNDYGRVLVYIQENEAGSDFRYSYAFIRVGDSHSSDGTAVIWGAGTPSEDNDRHGVGVTLWDFEANREFEAAHNPDYDANAPATVGRFAQVYGRGDADNKDGEFTFNVSVFRDFRPDDAEPEDQAANLDYFFGRFNGDNGERIDFVDWLLEGDLCDGDAATCFENNTPDEVAETLSLRAAFIDRGLGRAEATVSGGDLASGVSIVECWDEDINRTYIGMKQEAQMVVEEGACAAPFEAELEALGVPTLASVDAEVLAALDCVALNGIAGCDAK